MAAESFTPGADYLPQVVAFLIFVAARSMCWENAGLALCTVSRSLQGRNAIPVPYASTDGSMLKFQLKTFELALHFPIFEFVLWRNVRRQFCKFSIEGLRYRACAIFKCLSSSSKKRLLSPLRGQHDHSMFERYSALCHWASRVSAATKASGSSNH